MYNDRCRLLAGARLSDGVAPGVTLMATGAWFTPTWREDDLPATEQSGNPNVLTLDIGTSPLTQGLNAMSCLLGFHRCLPVIPMI
ncbi:hypothetical protein BK025_15705 [Sodalis sp. TME1]|nr:hypothetical protein BK025_15705 [Sodalis sp. TME1]